MISFKKINAWLHLWLGIASGIIVFILSVTGCILVFKSEIKLLAHSWMHAPNPGKKEMLPPSALYQSISSANPGKEIHSIWYHGHGKAAHVNMGDSIIYIDPYTAQINAYVNHEDFFHFIEEGHFYLWLPPEIGEHFTAWGTLVFFVLLVSGIILWWPKKWNRRSAQQAFTIKWKAKFKRVNYDLHNVLGFYSLIIALIFAFTGLMMSFAWFNNGVYWLAGGSAPGPRIEALSDTSYASSTIMLDQVDKAWIKGRKEIGKHNTDEIIIGFPEKASDAIYVCVDMYIGTWRDVYLDRYTLEELPATTKRFSNNNLAEAIRDINYGLHVGEIGGLTTKIIYFAASLICASLPVTGFYIWWGRRRKKRPLRS